MKKNKISKNLKKYWMNFTNQEYFEKLNTKIKKKKKNKLKKNKNYIFNISQDVKKKKQINKIDNFCIKTKNFSQKIFNLLKKFYKKGYLYANLDPLKKIKNFEKNSLNLKKFFFNSKEKKKKIKIKNIFNSTIKFKNVGELYNFLKKKYCKFIGYEYFHIENSKEKKWFHKKILSSKKNYKNNFKNKKYILNSLIFTKFLEEYIHIKYPGYKRFSLEGCDVLIPMIHELISYSSKNNVKNIFFGMPHRGRLNFLINIMGKSPYKIFKEFSNNFKDVDDVKYHLGYSSIIKTKYGDINLNLQYNPSHLEIITPVVMGYARAYLDSFNKNKNSILPVVIHGDASFIAQGVIQETLNISQTSGYHIGGSIHIVVNNQIGFTTSKITDSRSSLHCTNIMKMIDSPILHVNANDPNSCIAMIKLAVDYRQKFNKDICINLIGYRKHGHHESDEPSVTQPMMYKRIKHQKSISKKYFCYLKKKYFLKNNYFLKISKIYKNELKKNSSITLKYKSLRFIEKNTNIKKNKCIHNINIKKTIDINKLKKISKKINTLPKNIEIHHLVKKIYQNRLYHKKKNVYFDWGAIENLTYASLLNDGLSIRISGEDVSRGTFFHRQCFIHDQNNGNIFIPLQNFVKNHNNNFFIWDSALSEEAILAFEYGYSLNNHNILNIWEAQFGDFSNVAQVVFDQFIFSGEKKWNQYSSIVLYLPHGYEGQGPEHSSCRLERYLQMCANNNVIIIIPTKPSQMFHALRNYVYKNVKKPLIILTPKSFLRNPLAKSSFLDLSTKKFQTIIKDKIIDKRKIDRIIFCSGKIYYDFNLKKNNKNVLLIRIEQIYPFPIKKILLILKKYIHVKKIIWCQEEPRNQGAWIYVNNIFSKYFKFISKKIFCISRKSSSSTATGNFKIHEKEQNKIIFYALKKNLKNKNYGV
ncbi:2-oxoglutarate dehydrogenase E1 component [Buchnera aphidicola]|uniref:2-oxoglutarate dehydrogenase E1 component n=1 Tax=Buchnera aphidicola TaxID=9 RepID=UPI003463EFF3